MENSIAEGPILSPRRSRSIQIPTPPVISSDSFAPPQTSFQKMCTLIDKGYNGGRGILMVKKAKGFLCPSERENLT